MASLYSAISNPGHSLSPSALPHDTKPKKICYYQCPTFLPPHRSRICRMGFVSGLERKKTLKPRIISSVTVDTPVNTSPEKVQLPKGDTWSVHKFGGTCMGNSERIKNVAKIILSDDSERKFVVVSAMSKVTDMMYDLINKAQSRDESYISALDAVLEKHRSTALDLIDGDDLCSFLAQLQHDISNLKAMLRAIYIAGHATESFTDFVVGHGELWSAQMLSCVVRKNGVDCNWMDTREVLIVNPTSSNQVDPDFKESEERLEKWYSKNPSKAIVATGFIASTPQNIPTTLKRDGSDFSAAIMGALFKAGQVTIWTDVDGVYSADPRKVSEAVILKTLSYQEAWEMSYFGANVLHPRTIIPVMRYDIPIIIRNVFNLAAPGTKICRSTEDEEGQGLESFVKGFATIDNLALVNVEGTGMAGVPGTASTIFNAVKDVGANVIMISQASSEHSVCFAVPEKEVNAVFELLQSRFHEALNAGRLSQAATLKEEFNIDLRVMGITGSRTMLLSEAGIDLSRWRELQKEKGVVADMDKFVQHVHGNQFIPNKVLVDCTADSSIASHYYDWLRKGIHVVTPNKKANSGPLDQYLKIRALQRQSYTHYFYEATVGAGLPIINTLQGLLETGDKILRIEGVFSGTLSYIFNNFIGRRTFSEVVAEAKHAGYTEPDPRDDLSGTDVCRKVIILARESGLKLELSDIPVESLVPEPLKDSASAEEFMQKLPQFDHDLAKKRQIAEDAGQVLRYVGVVDMVNQEGAVKLQTYKNDHPFAQLSGADNIIAFTTTRYKDQPLIVRGPGAGAEVTAGGVFSDILRLASYLGAPS
ncbi:bifunctional aspartokinase/homoserine dehydrogenase 1, chloroplastic-like isoform X3 [Prunus dulcis]|uniref:bifunctional aspartokinase/homoserine dehydrogenase 1, chloroplastic-like isoform X3 n=1 Tax=Prunus dulcis TaxID=3755 RepID=UPI0014821310|nr:bifunctional aspartokinase/homoserine dehydrogenase 1, chloroplastic-like isoform X3 [Prunus dulcis]